MTRLGIAGTGWAGLKLMGPAIKSIPGATLWSVCGRSVDRAQGVATALGIANPKAAYGDFQAFVADPQLDAVLIATPDNLHHPMAMGALAAGKHVFIEKPMALRASECLEIHAESQKRGLIATAGYRCRVHDGHRKVKQAIDRGVFGQVRHLHASWAFVDPDRTWRCSPESTRWRVLSKIGTHMIDLCWWLSEATTPEPRAMQARLRRVHSPHEDTAFLSWEFANGVTADIYASLEHGDGGARFEIHTDRALIEFRNTLGGGGDVKIDGAPLTVEWADEYIETISSFVRQIGGQEKPFADAMDGWANLVLLEAALAAEAPARRSP